MTLLNNIQNLKTSIKNFPEAETLSNWSRNYKENKAKYRLNQIKTSLKQIASSIQKTKNPELSLLFSKFKEEFKNKNLKATLFTLEKLERLAKLIPENKKTISFKLPSLPSEIYNDIKADTRELEKCFNSNCFRSSIILCGRILETALHRKYYEITKIDLLEKAPGIGLGKIIAKLKEYNIEIEPGLIQQIHLINQVRIYSVHKKPSNFKPTKEQTNAIILYTLDILKKLF